MESGRSKIDFISELFSHKHLDNMLKGRLFELAAHELRTIEATSTHIISEIELLKGKVDALEKFASATKINRQSTNLPKYLNPREISGFLLAYNQNIILKSTTHSIDSNLLISIKDYLNLKEYSFEEHLAAIKLEFQKLTTQFSISKNLFAKIAAYINGGQLWSENRIEISWSSPELATWATENPNMCPNPEKDLDYEPFSFKKISLKSGAELKNFHDLTLFFKKQITVRSDNNLYDLVRLWNFQYSDTVEFLITPENIPKNIEFFTDIEKLQQSYKEIVEMCISEAANHQKDKPIIQIGLKEIKNAEQGTMVVFSIWHMNSKFNKTVDATITRYGKSFTNLITNQINGLCDWELSADFSNGAFRKISLWPIGKDVESLPSFSGVQFDLIFYR